jgi:hypothetical protein
MQPPLDELHAAAAASSTTSSSPPLERALPITGALPWDNDRGSTTSCQFAIHYMFESDDSLDRFVMNVRTPRASGHFIGTTFDGETVDRELARPAWRSSLTRQQAGAVEHPPRSRASTMRDGRAIEVFVETTGSRCGNTSYTSTPQQRLSGFELVEMEMFWDTAKRLARGSRAHNSAMNPVVRRFSGFSWFFFKRVR